MSEYLAVFASSLVALIGGVLIGTAVTGRAVSRKLNEILEYIKSKEATE